MTSVFSEIKKSHRHPRREVAGEWGRQITENVFLPLSLGMVRPRVIELPGVAENEPVLIVLWQRLHVR